MWRWNALADKRGITSTKPAIVRVATAGRGLPRFPMGREATKKRKKKKKDELFLKTFQQEAAHNPGDLSEIDTLHDASERAAAAWPLPLPGIYGG